MEAFVAIFSLIGSILSIILFFKLWGMTNDVDKIKAKYVDHVEKPITPNPTVRYFAMKESRSQAEATEYLRTFIEEDIVRSLAGKLSTANIEAVHEQITKRYSLLAADAGIEIPTLNLLKKFHLENLGRMPEGFEIGEKLKYRTQDHQMFVAKLVAFNKEEQTFTVETSTGRQFDVAIKDCEPGC